MILNQDEFDVDATSMFSQVLKGIVFQAWVVVSVGRYVCSMYFGCERDARALHADSSSDYGWALLILKLF